MELTAKHGKYSGQRNPKIKQSSPFNKCNKIHNLQYMKRILISFALTLIMVSGYAQEHLSFKGIPIEGSMTSFCQKLQSKGLTKLGTDNNITLFVGDFTGRQATIGVGATDDGENVHSVVVCFDESKDWKHLVETYDYYKDLYTRKYGKPTSDIEKIPNHYYDNMMLMRGLTQGTVTYESAWDVTGGKIKLSIEKSDSYGEGVVFIKYQDAINIENKIQKDLNDI